jgi:four helix bundle protein
MNKPHKKLDAWTEAIALSISIYRVTETFPKEHRFSLTDQIHRAAVSIPSNIAEGAARQTKKEFANFLHIAQASLSELDTQIEIAKQLRLLPESQWKTLDQQMNHIDKLLSGLIKYLRPKNVKHPSPHPLPLTPHP